GLVARLAGRGCRLLVVPGGIPEPAQLGLEVGEILARRHVGADAEDLGDLLEGRLGAHDGVVEVTHLALGPRVPVGRARALPRWRASSASNFLLGPTLPWAVSGSQQATQSACTMQG